MKNNMKSKLLIAGAVAAFVAFSTTVQAVPTPVTGFTGVATLASLIPGPGGLNLTVNYTVLYDSSASLVTGQYEYEYVVNNPSGNKDINGNPETVDSYNVSFNTTVLGALISGNYDSSTGGGITWKAFTPVAAGSSSGILFFMSDLAPIFGAGNASDAVPPSPWATIFPGGSPIPVPTVPDGGTTVLLLGAALSGLGLLRKKLAA
jgi:VPDSG-CTERM motif